MTLYTWCVGVSDHATTGFATTCEEAQAKVKEFVDRYKSMNVEVVHWSITDPNGCCLVSMDMFP